MTANGQTTKDAFTRQVAICNKRGLHARASAKFVNTASQFDAQIFVSKDGIEVPATSIMGLMLLAASMGDQVSIRASGKEAEAALEALITLVEAKFHED